MSVERKAGSGRTKRKHYRFRLTSAARTLRERDITRLSEDEARKRFEEIRFSENGGEPYCPHCGCTAVYRFKTRRLFKCQSCEKQFSLTSGTLFNSRKMSFGDILLAILKFVNPPQGKSSLSLADDLGCAPKTAFVLGHKFRKAMADMQAEVTLTGKVDVDGVFLNGYIRLANMKADRPNNLRAEYKALERCIVTMRERRKGGRSRAFFLKKESQGTPLILRTVQPSAHIFADSADSWQRLAATFAGFDTVNHSEGFSIDGIHINGIECQHLRIKRAQAGVYMTLTKAHAQNYADELSWRDDFRMTDNGRKMLLLARRASKMSRAAAKDWAGYWRKRPAVADT